jgi:hypothetical protein
MLFIHQQIQSFLNLGVCKEYPIMAKAKAPKKSVGVNPPSPLTSTPPASSDPLVAPVAAVPVRSTIEPEQTQAMKAEPFQSVSSQSASAKPEPARTAIPSATKTESRKTAGRPEIVKNETRANLVPINVEEEIRRLAYIFSERRGFEAGHETEDWLNAEREIRQRYHQQSA